MRRSRVSGVVAILLAIGLLDELVGGTRAAAWPLIRTDLGLDYAEIGLVLALPGLVGSALDPFIGVLGDTERRRALLVLGGFGFALSAVLTSISVGLWTLLVALLIGNPATGAFVSLSQATLMDLGPTERERRMAWWTLAGSFGYVGGPVLLAAALRIGVGWRGALPALALSAFPLTLALLRLPLPMPGNESSVVLLNSGWYAIPKAGLYGALPGRSGTAVAVGGLAGLVGTFLPLGMGLLAEAVGLGAAMWALLAAPVVLLVALPRR